MRTCCATCATRSASWRRTPGFTVVAILTLALGIGATSAIFSVVNGVLLRPLPYPNPESLVRVHEILQKFGRFSVAPATFLDWRQQNTVFERIARHERDRRRRSSARPAPSVLPGGLVSWDMFELLRGHAGARAEPSGPKKTRRAKTAVIIISHGMWQRRFGGDSGMLGQAITLSGTPVTVIGVMPAGLRVHAPKQSSGGRWRFGADPDARRPFPRR